MKPGKRARYVYEEPGKPRYDRFMFNLQKFWRTYHSIAESDLDPVIVERYKTDYIGVVASYASCAVSFDLPIAWSTEEEQQLKQLIEKEMNEVRKITKVMNKRIEQLAKEKKLCQ